jgi:chromosome segregation ATPase
MDVQQSTAPLMRQLESTERQNRTRAAAWAEIETKLRSDLEDHIIKLEKLTKERNELASSDKRSQRFLKEKEEEIASSLTTIDALTATIGTLEKRLEGSEEEIKRIKQELIVAERKASEGASKVRNEMMQTVVDSEERYRSQIDSLEEALEEESQRRALLETQMNDLVQSVSSLDFSHNSHTGNWGHHSPEKERKLISASNQASILQSTLSGFDSDIDDDDEQSPGERQAGGSFAAMEQLSLGLKGAKTELEALRKQLVTSEEIRASLLDELGAARQAVEKLPLFEQKISELTMEVKLKEMEIQGLKDDIADVKFLYRSQLDDLLEAKAISPLVQQDDYSFETQNVLVVDE